MSLDDTPRHRQPKKVGSYEERVAKHLFWVLVSFFGPYALVWFLHPILFGWKSMYASIIVGLMGMTCYGLWVYTRPPNWEKPS